MAFDLKSFIQKSREAGIDDTTTLSYLKKKGLVDESGGVARATLPPIERIGGASALAEIQKGQEAKKFTDSNLLRQLFSKQIEPEIFPAAKKETATFLAKRPAQLAVSLGEQVEQAVKGQTGATGRTYDLPLVEKIQSFQSEAETLFNDVIEGKEPLYAAMKPFLDVPMAFGEVAADIQIARAGMGVFRQLRSSISAVRKGSSLERALESTMPVASKKVAVPAFEKAGRPGGVYEAGKVFKTPKIAPTPHDVEVADSVLGAADFKKLGPVKSLTKINQRIEEMAQEVVEPALESRPRPFNLNQLQKRLNTEVSLPSSLKRGDVALERIKNNAIQEMLGFAKNNKQNTSGLWQARKEFDNLAQKEIGGGYFSNEERKAAEDIVYQVHKATNDYIAELADDLGPIFKLSMKRMALMFEARRNAALRYYAIIGKGAFSRLLAEHPTATKFGKILGVGALGAAGAVIGSKALR